MPSNLLVRQDGIATFLIVCTKILNNDLRSTQVKFAHISTTLRLYRQRRFHSSGVHFVNNVA